MLELIEVVLGACAGAWAGAAYGLRRSKRALAVEKSKRALAVEKKKRALAVEKKKHGETKSELERHRAMAALSGQQAEFIVHKKLGPCPLCASLKGTYPRQCQGGSGCDRATRHQHHECSNCKYEWIIDPT